MPRRTNPRILPTAREQLLAREVTTLREDLNNLSKVRGGDVSDREAIRAIATAARDAIVQLRARVTALESDVAVLKSKVP